MDTGRLIRVLCVTEGITMTELANRLGITRQALYKRLDGKMLLESFEECINALGYDLYYGKGDDIRKIR